MLTEVQVYRGYLESTDSPELLLKLPVVDTSISTNKYQITDIKGLGPVEADVSTTTHAAWDGVLYQNARTNSRNLVFDIRYQPNYTANLTIEKLRTDLYSIFAPKNKLEFRFVMADGFTVKTEGYVESHSPNIFSNTPSVQISIICPDSNFSAINGFGRTTTAPSLIDLTEFLGSAESEFRLALYPDRSVTKIEIDNLSDEKIVWEGALKSGDVFVLSTFRENKYIRVNGIMKLEELKQGTLSMTSNLSKPTIKINVSGTGSFRATWWLLPKYVGV